MKTIILIILLSITFHTYAGSQEEQRKYVFEKTSTDFLNFIKDGTINGLKSTYHSEYTYMDIYLDTSEHDLFKNN